MEPNTKKEISPSDFLFYHHRAFERKDFGAMRYIYLQYPEEANSVMSFDYINKMSSSDDDEFMYEFPILMETDRMTEARILNITAYLLGVLNPPSEYKNYLRKNIPYDLIFNYVNFRYQKNYNQDSLWFDYFLKLPKLKNIVDKRQIKSLEELIYRTCAYFEKYISDNAK